MGLLMGIGNIEKVEFNQETGVLSVSYNDGHTDQVNLSTLKTDISGEAQTRASADADLLARINTEIARAKNAESSTNTNLAAEIIRAKQAERDLLKAIQSEAGLDEEIARATAAETALNNAIESLEESQATTSGQITDLSTQIQNESTRAKNAENSNAAKIATEKERAEAAEKHLEELIEQGGGGTGGGVTQQQLKEAINNLDETVLHVSGAETATGVKTFLHLLKLLSGVQLGKESDKIKLFSDEGTAVIAEKDIQILRVSLTGSKSYFNFGYNLSGLNYNGIYAQISEYSNTETAITENSKIVPTGGQVAQAIEKANNVEVVTVTEQYNTEANKNYLFKTTANAIYLYLPYTNPEKGFIKMKIATTGKWYIISSNIEIIANGTGAAVVDGFCDGENWYISKQEYTIIQ